MGEEPRTAKEIIDQAIRKNLAAQYILYFFAFLLMFTSLSLLVWAVVFSGEALSIIIGAVVGSFCVPAVKSANRIRDENIAIRLLEQPLTSANSADEAARVLKNIYSQSFGATKRAS